MLSNIPKEFLIALVTTAGIAFALTAIYAVLIIIRTFIRCARKKNYEELIYNLILIACVVIVTVSWITNIGWIRFFFTILAIPFIHSVVFFWINFVAIKQLHNSKELKVITILSFAAYVSAYVFLPDGGDVGTMYVFFGLIHNSTVAGVCEGVSIVAFFAGIAFMICQLIMYFKLKKQENVVIPDE